MCDIVVYAIGAVLVWIVIKGGVKMHQDSQEIESIGKSFQSIAETLTGRSTFAPYPGKSQSDTSTVFIGPHVPVNAKEGDIWFDDSGLDTPKVKVTVTEENSTDWLIQYIADELERETRK